jgi:HEAT repeat protein
MTADLDVRSIQRALEDGSLAPEDALAPLGRAARELETPVLRDLACRTLGAISGRAYGPSWTVAERAAFALLELAREADSPQEQMLLLAAMGRGFRNAWLMPYVHSRLSDEDEGVVVAAISAAGGLAFPALEETIAATFLGADVDPATRAVAIASLGRMGAESAAARLVSFVEAGTETEAEAALSALTEIRSPAGREAGLALLASEPSSGARIAAVRYLAEIGDLAVERHLRALARAEGADLRLAASFARRALEAERSRDAGERILAALTERDRAVRSILARRLRTLPVAEVVEQAEVLFSDDPGGVIQIIAEVRAPEVTKLLLRIAEDASVDAIVRERAAGSIEADESWERDALVALATGSAEASVRAAAAQTLGAFAPPSLVTSSLASLADDAAPVVRGALLWALQLSARPRELQGSDRVQAEALVKKALGDPDVAVRRRAAYVAGNLDASALVPDLVRLAGREEGPEGSSLRIAAFVALGDIGSPARYSDLVHLWNREDDPEALGAASRALERSYSSASSASGDLKDSMSPRSAPASLARVHDRLPKLLASADARVRAAAARVAGLAAGAVPYEPLGRLAVDPAPRVRRVAVVALGRAFGAEAEAALGQALDDADAAVQERAAEALLAIDSPAAATRVLDFVTGAPDRAAALRIAKALRARSEGIEDEARVRMLGAALARVGHDDPVYESLLELKLVALEAVRPRSIRAPIDTTIAQLFPTWTRLRTVRGFAPLGRSLRTAEMLFASSMAGSDADLSAGIVLWMKSLEGYLHAWLSPRLRSLSGRSSSLWELTAKLGGSAWISYQRYLDERWADPVQVGALSVEVPLRSVVNVLRDLQDKLSRPIDSPMSVTEWSRILLFLGVDHPSGPKNVLEIACRDADRSVRLLHKLQVLAQVRNTVTHRSTADGATLTEFRRAYYQAFEELTHMA